MFQNSFFNFQEQLDLFAKNGRAASFNLGYHGD